MDQSKTEVTKYKTQVRKGKVEESNDYHCEVFHHYGLQNIIRSQLLTAHSNFYLFVSFHTMFATFVAIRSCCLRATCLELDYNLSRTHLVLISNSFP